MGLVKITFDGSSVSAKQDADINHFLGGLVPAGIIRGLGDELQITSSNNYIYFKSGYVQIYGRRIYVEPNSNVYISLDSTKYGYVVIEVNLSNNTVTLKKLETSSSSYPSLTQQNLLSGGTIYQMPIAKYSKTTTSLTIQQFDRVFIENALPIANQALSKANSLRLKSTRVWKYTYDDNGNLSRIEMNISSIPDEALLVFTFETDDPYAYGAFINVCGSIVLNRLDLAWNSNALTIRNISNTGEIKVTITSSDSNNVIISFSTTTEMPSVVVITGYYVG